MSMVQILIEEEKMNYSMIKNFKVGFGLVTVSTILLLFLGFKIYHSQVKTDFYFISQLCKVIMIVGILSIPLFTYLHLN